MSRVVPVAKKKPIEVLAIACVTLLYRFINKTTTMNNIYKVTHNKVSVYVKASTGGLADKYARTFLRLSNSQLVKTKYICHFPDVDFIKIKRITGNDNIMGRGGMGNILAVLHKVNIIHTFGKGKGCTNNGISEHADDLTYAFGGDYAWATDADLVLCDGTCGTHDVIVSQNHLNNIMGRDDGYVKLVDREKKYNGAWTMCGGNYGYDDGVPGRILKLKFPIKIHDRVEH